MRFGFVLDDIASIVKSKMEVASEFDCFLDKSKKLCWRLSWGREYMKQ
jgi:hypothetical protein